MFTEIPDDEEMESEEDFLFSLMAGSAAAAFRPRQPAVSCDCGKRLDELISAIGELRREMRGLRAEVIEVMRHED